MITISIDGSCLGNPGKGGWAFVMRHVQYKKELWGSEPHTTNNRMEVLAAIKALAYLKPNQDITVISDSQYLILGASERMMKWKANDWQISKGKPVANLDLWQALEKQIERHHSINWEWTKGHAAHVDNNRCHMLAYAAAL